MTRVALAKRVGEIVVYGNIILVLLAIYAYLRTPYPSGDIVQLGLMGAPTFLLVAVSAFKYLSGQVRDNRKPADRVWARLSIVVTVVVLIFLAGIYILASMDAPDWLNVDIDGLKYINGLTETALAAYLGVIRERLFPEAPAS